MAKKRLKTCTESIPVGAGRSNKRLMQRVRLASVQNKQNYHKLTHRWASCHLWAL